MALRIDQITSGEILILRARGRITLGDESRSLRKVIDDLLETGHRKILLNLEDVAYIDSAGLGTLVSVHSSVRSRGGVLKLTGVRTKIHDLLQITKLVTVVDVAENEDEALHGDWSGPRAI